MHSHILQTCTYTNMSSYTHAHTHTKNQASKQTMAELFFKTTAGIRGFLEVDYRIKNQGGLLGERPCLDVT